MLRPNSLFFRIVVWTLLKASTLEAIHDKIPEILVFDVFFYNGQPIVELRLRMLSAAVDRFYIVESWETFSGIRKSMLYKDADAEIFAPYNHKITWIILDKEDFRNASGNAWRREELSRNAPVKHVIDDMAPVKRRSPYVLLVCDVDEIPRPDVVTLLRDPENYKLLTHPAALRMEFFYYNFAWVKKFPWTHPFVITEESLRSYPNLNAVRTSRKPLQIANGGWHCSYCESVDDIVRKIESFSHQERNRENIKKHAYIVACMKNGVDLFARGPDEDLIPYDLSSLPSEVRAFHYELRDCRQLGGATVTCPKSSPVPLLQPLADTPQLQLQLSRVDNQ